MASKLVVKFPLTVELAVDSPQLSRVLDAEGKLIPNVVRAEIHLIADMTGVYVTLYVANPDDLDKPNRRIYAIEGRLGCLREWRSIQIANSLPSVAPVNV